MTGRPMLTRFVFTWQECLVVCLDIIYPSTNGVLEDPITLRVLDDTHAAEGRGGRRSNSGTTAAIARAGVGRAP
jgi:hypothetical protein